MASRPKYGFAFLTILSLVLIEYSEQQRLNSARECYSHADCNQNSCCVAERAPRARSRVAIFIPRRASSFRRRAKKPDPVVSSACQPLAGPGEKCYGETQHPDDGNIGGCDCQYGLTCRNAVCVSRNYGPIY